MTLSPLAELHRRFIVEETAAALRHDLRNKFAAIANARAYLKRRFEAAAPTVYGEDARVAKFFDLIGSELVGAEATLTNKLPPLCPDPVEEVSCDVSAIVQRRIAETDWQGIAVSEPARVGSEPLLAVADGLELELALFCIFENAIDAGSRAVSVTASVDDRNRAVIELLDDGSGLAGGADKRAFEPFFTTKPGRLGIGLNMVKRIVFRSNGELEHTARSDVEHGVRVTIRLPRSKEVT